MRQRPLLLAIAPFLFLGAWYYAATLKTVSSQVTVQPLVFAPLSQGLSADVRAPHTSAGGPEDPFAPAIRSGGPSQSPQVPELPPLPLPPPPPEPALAPPLEEAPFKLTGIITGAGRRAVLEGNQTAYVVKERDEVEGWIIIRIDSLSVTLRSPTGAEIVIELETPTAAPREPSP